MEVLRQGTEKIAVERVSYLVDMAKAEALDAMGENRAAVELIERHLKA
jgi:RNase P subunit RPR2